MCVSRVTKKEMRDAEDKYAEKYGQQFPVFGENRSFTGSEVQKSPISTP